MKKVSLSNAKAEPINFLLRGQRHSPSEVAVVIDAKGVPVKDEDAAMLEDRLGSAIRVEDFSEKDVEKEAAKAAKAAEDAAKAAGAGNKTPEPSDVVKKLAEENDIDLSTVTGTGANGNIVKADIEAIIAAKTD